MKVRRFSQFQGQILFPNVDNLEKIFDSFLQTRLGSLYQAIPWEKLVSGFNLKEKRKGPRSIFSARGKIGLMFLKHFAACSDRKLIEHLNANIHYQIFCDLVLEPGELLTNYKIVSEIRCELSEKLDIDKLQSILAKYWKPHMSNLDSMCCDATCYESAIRYPTDIKLLWESTHWSYNNLSVLSKLHDKKLLRTKKVKWTRRYINYSKSKRPSRKEKRALRRGLLKLLKKIDEALVDLEQIKPEQLTQTYWERRTACRKVLVQQWEYFFNDVKPNNRIVSIDKPYLRPIVRGKEIKKVEFGAKVHKFQVDGIGFIEHLSFNAFNEGTRLKETIWAAQKLFSKKIKIVGADKIYATNANRKYVTKNGIKTDFKRKGKPSQHKHQYDQLAAMITKERATRLEGSFGTDKEYFLLKRIKARTEKTEKLWLFFGIHTSNGINIGCRITQSLAQAA